MMFSQASCVGRLRSVVGHVKRRREEAWPDDDDDDDDENSPQPKLDVLKGRLDLLDEADEMVATGDNFPGACVLVSLWPSSNGVVPC